MLKLLEMTCVDPFTSIKMMSLSRNAPLWLSSPPCISHNGERRCHLPDTIPKQEISFQKKSRSRRKNPWSLLWVGLHKPRQAAENRSKASLKKCMSTWRFVRIRDLLKGSFNKPPSYKKWIKMDKRSLRITWYIFSKKKTLTSPGSIGSSKSGCAGPEISQAI